MRSWGVTYDEGAHAKEQAESEFLLEWEVQGHYHGDGDGDDEDIAAEVEYGLHNGVVLESCALRVWRGNGPVSFKGTACGEEERRPSRQRRTRLRIGSTWCALCQWSCVRT
jgi:hypothetical protein